MPNVELNWQQIDVLITDNQLAAESKNLIERHGVEVVIA